MRNIIVTGGNRGLGYETAKKLRAAGAGSGGTIDGARAAAIQPPVPSLNVIWLVK